MLYALLPLILVNLSSSAPVKSAVFPYYYDPQDFPDDTDDYYDLHNSGRTVLLAPTNTDLLAGNYQSKKPAPGRLFKPGEVTPDQVQKRRLQTLLKDAMTEIMWKITSIKTMAQKGMVIEVSDVVDFVYRTYRDLLRQYTSSVQNNDNLHARSILATYDKLTEGNSLLSSIISLFRHKSGAVGTRIPLKYSPGQRQSIAWSYYDDTLA